MFQHTAARRRLQQQRQIRRAKLMVSTHSRAKAAAARQTSAVHSMCCFNTQPREGGCKRSKMIEKTYHLFQHTAARRRLRCITIVKYLILKVSTHSRAKAAANDFPAHFRIILSFNTQPREGGCEKAKIVGKCPKTVSTHSRAKAAARIIMNYYKIF